jgi:ABC-type amino acid transport substrate-binding protein
MTRSRFFASLIAILLVLAPLAVANAQTVDEIIKRGKVIIGVNTTTPIFGLMGKDGEPEGYDPDVARLVGKYLGVPVEFVSVTGATASQPAERQGRHADLPVRHHAERACRFGIRSPMPAKPRRWSGRQPQR